MGDISVEGGVGPSLSEAETAFFNSGGEAEIPREEGEGATNAETTVTESADKTPADKTADDNGTPGVKTPPDRLLAAVHEERGKRKGLEKQLREQAERLANFEGKFSIIEKLNKPAVDAAAETATVPTAEEDIFGAVKHVGETVAQMQKRLDEQDKASKAAGEQTAFVNNYRADAAAFEAKTPDSRAAYNFLLNSRASELLAIGFADPKALAETGADQAEVEAAARALHDALVADEFAIADRAFKAKKSPAEIIYNLAKQRGFVTKAAGDGKTPGTEKLEQIEKGQQTNKSLNAAGGGSGGDDMTAERLLSMPMDEFESWCGKHPAKAKAIMGG